MNSFTERDELGTSRSLTDFGRFKGMLTQIEHDEEDLRELIVRFVKKPSHDLLKEMEKRSSYLKAGMEAVKELVGANGVDGAVFYCAEVENRVADLLGKVREILEEYHNL